MSNLVRSAKVLISEAHPISCSYNFGNNFYYKPLLFLGVINGEDIASYLKLKILSKNDGFFDLTLAKFCLFKSTIFKIFTKAVAENNTTLNLAYLSTTNLSKSLYGKVLCQRMLFSYYVLLSVNPVFNVVSSYEPNQI